MHCIICVFFCTLKYSTNPKRENLGKSQCGNLPLHDKHHHLRHPTTVAHHFTSLDIKLSHPDRQWEIYPQKQPQSACSLSSSRSSPRRSLRTSGASSQRPNWPYTSLTRVFLFHEVGEPVPLYCLLLYWQTRTMAQCNASRFVYRLPRPWRCWQVCASWPTPTHQ